MDHLTLEQQALIQTKQEQLRKQFEEYAAKQLQSKISDICTATGVSKEEAGCALSICENDELEAINRIATESSFKLKVQEMASGTSERFDGEEDIEPNRNRPRPEDNDDDEEEDDDDEGFSSDDNGKHSRKKQRQRKYKYVPKGKGVEGFNADGTPRAPTIRLGDALKRLQEVKAEKAKKSKKSKKEEQYEEQEQEQGQQQQEEEEKVANDDVFEENDNNLKTEQTEKNIITTTTTTTASANNNKDQDSSPSPNKKKKKNDDDYTFEDLKSLEWSDARIKAFLGRKSNPNAYYYRFNAPGEAQHTGAWKKEEHDNFMKLINTGGVDYRWGILSMSTPGRVGYQCSNYYRKLVADGKIIDPNYIVDEKGKLTFLRGDKRIRSTTEDGGVSSLIQPTINTVSQKKKKRSIKRSKSEMESENESPLEEDDENDEEENSKGGNKKKEYLLEMNDAMTMKPMETPAISPFGHVLDYTTWLRLLRETPQNTCPFTKQRVTRRDLIKLTNENINEFRDKIVVVNYDLVRTTVTAATTTEDMDEEDVEEA